MSFYVVSHFTTLTETRALHFRKLSRVLRRNGRLVIAQIVPFDDPDDHAWWRDVVGLRQPLRRDRSTYEELVAVLLDNNFADEAVRFLERPTY